MARRWTPYIARRTEPDMELEFNNMFDGVFPEISKKQTAVLRTMRTPLTNNVCDCVDSTTKEPDRDHFCPYCFGEGHYWDETFIDVYKEVIKSDVGNALIDRSIGPGDIGPSVVRFFLRSSVNVTKYDRIVELVLDDDGDPVSPYSRKAVYGIGSVIEFRSDNAKLDYVKVVCYQIDQKFLNGVE